MNLPSLVRDVPLLEELLSGHAREIGADLPEYRGHCYRVLNFCAALAPVTPESLEKIAIAAAFHDLGIWTDGTFDYLRPSMDAAARYLATTGREQWTGEITRMILEHHKISRFRETGESLVEPFRRADWIDVSYGWLTFGLSRRLVREAFEVWPSAGFHRRLIELAWQRLRTHPASPLPMMRW